MSFLENLIANRAELHADALMIYYDEPSDETAVAAMRRSTAVTALIATVIMAEHHEPYALQFAAEQAAEFDQGEFWSYARPVSVELHGQLRQLIEALQTWRDRWAALPKEENGAPASAERIKLAFALCVLVSQDFEALVSFIPPPKLREILDTLLAAAEDDEKRKENPPQ